MAFPDFNDKGDLPIGVHKAPLNEIIKHFGTGTTKRQQVARRLERIFKLAAATGKVGRFIIFGSFVTNKAEPNDVDIFLLMNDDFDASQLG